MEQAEAEVNTTSEEEDSKRDEEVETAVSADVANGVVIEKEGVFKLML